MPPPAILQRLEEYYDAVPRTASRMEAWPPFTFFAKAGHGWPYYARPTLGATVFTAQDVARVRQRQRELALPEAFEWVAEISPDLAAAISAAGLTVHEHPLMVLDPAARRTAAGPVAADVRLVTPHDDLPLVSAAAHVAFSAPGTEVGEAGITELRRVAFERGAESVAFSRERLLAGYTISAAAFEDGVPVSTGSHQPTNGVTEIVGVGTVPAYRRRGLGAAVVELLVEDALERGASTVFLSAGDESIARVYQRLGFRRAGTACTAAP